MAEASTDAQLFLPPASEEHKEDSNEWETWSETSTDSFSIVSDVSSHTSDSDSSSWTTDSDTLDVVPYTEFTIRDFLIRASRVFLSPFIMLKSASSKCLTTVSSGLILLAGISKPPSNYCEMSDFESELSSIEEEASSQESEGEMTEAEIWRTESEMEVASSLEVEKQKADLSGIITTKAIIHSPPLHYSESPFGPLHPFFEAPPLPAGEAKTVMPVGPEDERGHVRFGNAEYFEVDYQDKEATRGTGDHSNVVITTTNIEPLCCSRSVAVEFQDSCDRRDMKRQRYSKAEEIISAAEIEDFSSAEQKPFSRLWRCRDVVIDRPQASSSPISSHFQEVAAETKCRPQSSLEEFLKQKFNFHSWIEPGMCPPSWMVPPDRTCPSTTAAETKIPVKANDQVVGTISPGRGQDCHAATTSSDEQSHIRTSATILLLRNDACDLDDETGLTDMDFGDFERLLHSDPENETENE